MQADNRYILTIAGFDPSGGAGVLADIKVFEQFGLTGLAVTTCITYQNESSFAGVKWLDRLEIVNQLKPLLGYAVDVVKVGLVESPGEANWLFSEIKKVMPNAKIVWDPILKASAGYSFHSEINNDLMKEMLAKIYCITPNLQEAEKLGDADAFSNMQQLSEHCFVWLKGGHSQHQADDILFKDGKTIVSYSQEKIDNLSKHGSGCVFSSALASALARGASIEEAGKKAKEYTFAYLKSTSSLLGKHKYLRVEI